MCRNKGNTTAYLDRRIRDYAEHGRNSTDPSCHLPETYTCRYRSDYLSRAVYCTGNLRDNFLHEPRLYGEYNHIRILDSCGIISRDIETGTCILLQGFRSTGSHSYVAGRHKNSKCASYGSTHIPRAYDSYFHVEQYLLYNKNLTCYSIELCV